MKRVLGKDRPRKVAGRRGLAALLAALTVLLAAGAMVGYGFAFHVQPVLMEEKVDLSEFARPDSWPPDLADFGGEPELPGMVRIITLEESEPELIREVTFGGVVRTPEGEIKRTYTGRPPSQCPT